MTRDQRKGIKREKIKKNSYQRRKFRSSKKDRAKDKHMREWDE